MCVKDFDEKYSDEVKRRIGGITYQNNTRLGAAIRHATAKLAKQEARTRLLIVLSDGRPYDHDYGDARYAREDTREALRQAKVRRASRRSASRSIANRKRSCAIFTARSATRSSTMCCRCLSGCREFIDG